MDSNKLHKLIVKYLTNSITKKEWKDLNSRIQKSVNTDVFYEYLKINYAIDNIMGEFNTKKTRESVLNRIRRDKRKTQRLKVIRVLSYAAVVILFLGIGYFFQYEFSSNNRGKSYTPSEANITLELEGVGMKVISEGKTAEIVNEDGVVIGTQKGNRIVYSDTNLKSDKLVYSQLNVPHGKRFELELSDGTVAYLNAGSSLKYPIQFIDGQAREVYLVGEVFLDVTKDSGKLFTVKTSNNLDVHVLGTRFNVSNYPEDEITEVVLVEGSVGLNVGNKTDNTILKPGFKGSFNKQEKNITTKPVITSLYTSWMNGELVFRNISFENILKKLERHYNVTISNQNIEYAEKKFNANFGDEPITTVLNYFRNTYGIDYTINDNNIIIE